MEPDRGWSDSSHRLPSPRSSCSCYFGHFEPCDGWRHESHLVDAACVRVRAEIAVPAAASAAVRLTSTLRAPRRSGYSQALHPCVLARRLRQMAHRLEEDLLQRVAP